ncbi:protein FAR1-RELATED SEQUENCE 3-like [Primulina eburnea]|uniref:protein FAR1-RELATED SEQUENCE 3-like n=1 Tax=Primulina eburnea TaxID=1245227 RepID=UPI003C6C2D6D
MVNDGIFVSNVVSFMEHEACGIENLGFIRKDAYDHMSRLKKHTKVENRDATALIKYFIDKANKENYFYWNVQLDDDDRVMNFFFRDYRCSVDYEFFGDMRPKALLNDSHHRLCQWHINQNAPSHFGSLNGDSNVKKLWYKCMNFCESEYEFEATWKYMIDTYNLDGHKWLNGMYRIKKKWATAFSNGEFSIQKNWLSKEKTEDTRCRHGKPPQILKNHLLLIHAADVYTISIYQLFEIELVNSLNCKSLEPPAYFGNDWNWIQIKVKSHDENPMVRHVVFNKQSREIKSSCCKFETMGILCKHVLMVFNCMDVTIIPKCYILRRWMKNIKSRVSTDLQESESGGDGGAHVSQMEFVKQIMRSVYDLNQLSKPYDFARKTLYTLVDTAKDEISKLVMNLSINEQCDDDPSEDQIGEVCIRNPLTAKAKGITKANITRYWDHTSKKRKGKRKGKAEI